MSRDTGSFAESVFLCNFINSSEFFIYLFNITEVILVVKKNRVLPKGEKELRFCSVQR